MSLDIHADLLAEQQKTSYEPSLLLTIEDNGLPHPRRLFDLAGQGNEPTAACVIPGVVIIRARHNTGVGVEIQRITDPTQKAQWESWTLHQSGAGYPALLTTESGEVVLAWQEVGSTAVRWQRSADNGLTWSAAQTLWTPGYPLAHLQVGASSTSDGYMGGALFWAHGSTVYWRMFDPTAGQWAAPYSHDFGATVRGLGALYTGGGYLLAVALADYDPTATRSLVLGEVPWDEDGVTVKRYFDLHGSTGAAYDLAWPSLARLGEGLGARLWLSFALGADPAAGAYFESTQVLAAGVNFGNSAFTSPVWLRQAQADRLTWLDWGGGVAYGCSYGLVYQSQPLAPVTAETGQIISYTLAGGPDSTLSLTLDNSRGDFTGLEAGRLGARLTLARGAVVNGVAQRVAREPFTVTAVEWSADNRRVTLTAANAVGLLRRWRAEFAYTRLGLTLYDLVRELVGLAGAGLVVFPWGSGAWLSTMVPEFVIQSGQSALEALQALQQQYQFRFRPFTGHFAGWPAQGLELFVLADTPPVACTFGPLPGQHPTFFPEVRSARRLPDHTHALVIAAGVGGEAIDLELQAETGRQFTKFIRRKFITSPSAATAAAAASLAGAQQGMTPARLVCLPAFHLQPFDVVKSDGWEPEQIRSVAAVREIYDTQRYPYAKIRLPWYQEIDLGSPSAPSTSSGGGPSTGSGDGPSTGSGREIRRASLVSFNPTTWKALVQLENSPAATEYPAGQWLPAWLLTAGASVAVILFDESNPNDGLIVGPYGAAAPVLGAATASAAGLVALATADEVAAGTESAKAVTPATLHAREPFYLDWANATNKPYADELARKSLAGTISAAGWFTCAASPLNPGPYLAVLKISVTGGATIRHELLLRLVGNGPAAPTLAVESAILTAGAATSGIRYLRAVYPKALNNGSGALLDFYTYDATAREFTIELIEAVNFSLSAALSGSAYNSTTQNVAQSTNLYYTGAMPAATVYAALSGNAASATWASNFYNATYVAGESLVANDLLFLQSDSKWYRANVAGRTIPLGAPSPWARSSPAAPGLTQRGRRSGLTPTGATPCPLA